MGHNQSKQKHPTKHVLGGGQPRQPPLQTQQPKQQGGKNVLGGAAPQQQATSQGAGDARAAAAEAAERRLKAVRGPSIRSPWALLTEVIHAACSLRYRNRQEERTPRTRMQANWLHKSLDPMRKRPLLNLRIRKTIWW